MGRAHPYSYGCLLQELCCTVECFLVLPFGNLPSLVDAVL